MSVPTNVRPKLLQLVEEHVTSLIQDSISVQRHTKRARLNQYPETTSSSTTNNSTSSNKTTSNTSSSSSSSNSNSYFKTRLHTADINLALQLKGCEKLYGYPTTMLNPSTTTGQQQLQTKVMLSDLLKEEVPLPPEEVSMKQHWLVIDGLHISELHHTNANTDGTTSFQSSNATTELVSSKHTSIIEPTYESSDVLLRIHQLQSGLLSEELKLYFLRVINTIEKECYTYYDRSEQDMILQQLQYDTGLQELVPFFVRYTQHAIYEHVRNHKMECCIIIVRLIRSLLLNPTLHLELHLHEILPSLITCVVTKSLNSNNNNTNNRSSSSNKNTNTSNEYNVRYEAAITLTICTFLFSNDYTTLKSRILRTLCQALDTTTIDDHHNNNNMNLSSRYGSIIAITLFGNRAIDAFLLPLLMDCWDVWEEELYKKYNNNSTTNNSNINISPELEMDIIMCQNALLNAVGTYIQHTTIEEHAQRFIDLGINDVLGGDRMMILSSDYETEYNMCFV
jgi:transcription initiation factor TFIID subunit 6